MSEPTVKSNTIYECAECRAKYDFEEMPAEPRCQHCGCGNFLQVVVVAVCDFCSHNLIEGEVWTHPCKDFEYDIDIGGAPSGGSKGDWAACQTCHELIEAGDRKAVAKRTVEREIEMEPEAAEHYHFAYAIASRIQGGFFENRTGPGYPEPDIETKKGERP